MIIEILVPAVASAVVSFLGGLYFEKRRSERQIKKGRVDRVNAEFINALEEKRQAVNSVSWTSHLLPSRIREVKRNNLAYVNEGVRKRIESLTKSLREISDLAKKAEEKITKLALQELKGRRQSEMGGVNERGGPSRMANKVNRAFMALLPFESAERVENHEESFADYVQIGEKRSEGKIGYFDIFKIANSLERRDYLGEGETAGKLLSDLFSRVRNKEVVQDMLTQREEATRKMEDLIKDLQEELDEVYRRE